MKHIQSIKDFIRSCILLSIIISGLTINHAQAIENASNSTNTSTNSSDGSSSNSSQRLQIDYPSNDILYYDPNALCGAAAATTTATLNGNTNLEKIYNYMLGKGLKDFQAAGVVGNISRESGGYPDRLQGHSPNDGSNNPEDAGGGGWGLIQWTPGRKVIGLAQQANAQGKIYELQTQLDIIWWHMNDTTPTGVKNFLPEYKNTTTVEDATTLFERKMEGAGVPALADRIAAAKLALKYTQSASAVNTLAASSTTGCSCSETVASDATADVLLDPGHSGINKQGDEVDPATKLYIGDSNNTPEKDQVFDVAQKVKATLESKGYKVIMTKNSADDYVNLADRAKIGNKAKVQIAVSIHNTPGKFGSAKVGWVAPQKVGNYRTNTDGKKITYDNSAIAAKSQDYANKIKDARAAAEGGAQIHDLNFDGRPGLSPGNLSIVQLMSEVPWVYNEVGQSGFNATKYADGIANGIIAAVKPATNLTPTSDSATATAGQSSTSISTTSSSSTSADNSTGNSASGCGGAANGNAVKTAVNYAWPEYHAAPYTEMKTSYAEATKKAIAAGKYTGGLPGYKGIDCGGFITRVMQDSGVDPDYGDGGNTGSPSSGQWGHMAKSSLYQELHPNTTADLQPGDIAINGDHTYMYVGKVAGFSEVVASSSISWNGGPGRAPMAGKETPADHKYHWFRFLGSKAV